MSSNNGVVGNARFLVPETFVQSAITDAIEQRVAATLPTIPELDSSLSSADRCAVLGAAVERSVHAFVAVWGDAFGCESIALPSVPADWAAAPPAYQIRAVVAA